MFFDFERFANEYESETNRAYRKVFKGWGNRYVRKLDIPPKTKFILMFANFANSTNGDGFMEYANHVHSAAVLSQEARGNGLTSDAYEELAAFSDWCEDNPVELGDKVLTGDEKEHFNSIIGVILHTTTKYVSSYSDPKQLGYFLTFLWNIGVRNHEHSDITEAIIEEMVETVEEGWQDEEEAFEPPAPGGHAGMYG